MSGAGLLLSGYLPGEDRQGLSALAERLLAEPDLTVPCVVVLEQLTLSISRLDPDKEPTLTLRIRSLEPVAGQDAQTLDEILRRVRSERIGQDELPDIADDPTPAAPSPRSRRGRRGKPGLQSV